MENNENKFLGTEKVSKLLLKFSIPCILSLIIASLYNIVDQIFIGHSIVGALGNSATGIVYPITILSMAFAWCFGDGSAAYLSLCQGRKDTKNSHISIGNNIVITFIISLIFVALCLIFMEPLLSAFGATTVVETLENGFSNSSMELAKDYFTIILIFIPGYMITNSLSSVIRADGSPGYSMLATLAGAIINIILDPIFIFVFDMGIKGAAWATIIGQMISFLITIIYLFRTKTFKLNMSSFRINMNVFSNVIKLGVSTFITQLAIVIISLVCNFQLARYGAMGNLGPNIPIAVIGIAMKVFSIVINIVVGIIVGAQPILGYNFGAKKYDRVKETFKIVSISTLIVGLISCVLFETIPNAIFSIFGTGQGELYELFAAKTLRIFLLLVAITCFIKMTSIFFQAVGQPVKSAVSSLARDILFFVPLVLILPNFMGIEGVLWAAPIADLIGLCVVVPLLVSFFKKINNEEVGTAKEHATLKKSKPGIIITISRTHGSRGKKIGELVAKKLDIPYYYKEAVSIAAKTSGLDKEFISKINETDDKIHSLYLSSTPVKYAITAQDKAINMIADKGACVIVGRAADYVLRNRDNVINIFITAPLDYRVESIMEMYNDTKSDAKKNALKSDKNRASYYKLISNKDWGNIDNYDLCINSEIGVEASADIIVDYIKNIKK